MTSMEQLRHTELEMMSEEQLRRQHQDRIALKIQAVFVRFLMVFQAVTQMYVTEYYLLDFVFQNFSSFTRALLRLWAWHHCLVGVVNWICIIYYSNEYIPSKHRPPNATDDNIRIEYDVKKKNDVSNETTSPTTVKTSHNQNEPSTTLIINNNEPSIINNKTSHNGEAHTASVLINNDVNEEITSLPWTFCDRCRIVTPPRTRHCKKCEKCIVRRDHHCELVGCCIGHWNQRFFVVLAAYGVCVSYIGAYMTISYLYHHHTEDLSLWNYFLAAAFVQGILGYVSWFHVLLVYHATMLCIFCPLTTGYFMSEFSLIIQGKTMHEVMKKKKHIKVLSSIKERLWLAFGDHWWLNFIFPLHFFLPHTHNGVEYPGVVVTLGPGASQPHSDEPENKKEC